MIEYVSWFAYGFLIVGLAGALVSAVRHPATASGHRNRWTFVGPSLLGAGLSVQLVVFIADRNALKATATAVALILVGLTLLVRTRQEPQTPSQPEATIRAAAKDN